MLQSTFFARSWLLIAASAILPQHVYSACTVFTPTSGLYTHSDYSQNQTVSNGTYCSPTFNNHSNVLGGYGSCYTSFSNNNNYSEGCAVRPMGGVVQATGTTNLTLSAADTAAVFALVAATGNISTSNYTKPGTEDQLFLGNGFYQSFSGCSDESWPISQSCVAPGSAGWVEAIPLLKCINGTLGGCTGGPVVNGTAVSICGVGKNTWEVSVHNRILANVSYPYLEYVFTSGTIDQAKGLTGNPATYTNCSVYYQEQNVAVGLIASNGLMLGCLSLLGVVWTFS